LTPDELRMTPDQLRKAAANCREIARKLQPCAVQISTANVAAAAANPTTSLAVAATTVCGSHLPNAINNMVDYFNKHADTLDRAAAEHDKTDAATADAFRRAPTFGPASARTSGGAATSA
jgi:hypothetical protein